MAHSTPQLQTLLKSLHQDILQGHAPAALPKLVRLQRRQPQNPTVFALQAEALRRMGQARAAGAAFRRAASLGGDKVYWVAAGTLLAEEHQFDDALECLKRAAADAPDDPAVLDALIVTLLKSDRMEQGVESARRQLALSTDPAHLNNAAQLLLQTGTLGDDRYAECAAAYRKVDRLAPDAPQFWGPALIAASYICDWEWCESLQRRIRTCYARGDFNGPNESAFWNLSWCADESVNLGVTRAQLQRRLGTATIAPVSVRPLPPAGRRLRVGYLSCDFCDHATLHLMTGVFEHHDRGNFEIFAYDYSAPDDSQFRRRFLAAVEHHVPVGGMDDLQAAERIAADQLDILIDLKLYTRGLRPGIIARRPAPVIAVYLGFPGSAATSSVDYVIGDRFVTPDSSAAWYPEKFCRLPQTYQCNDRRRSTAPTSGGRAAHGLPEDAIVFASFNQAYKMDRASFELWMQVLAAVPGSVLWLLSQSQAACDRLLQHAQAAGIDPGRIIFAPPLNHHLHRARLPLADAVLDTLVYNGHTSTADALWAGVPVVTARGSHFASRVSESLLHAAGMPELVGADPAEMLRIGVRVGTDAPWRQQLRERLAASRLSAPLFDTARFTRDFEAAIKMMTQRSQQGLDPAHIDVPDAGPVSTLEPPAPAPVPAAASVLNPAVERAAALISVIPEIASGSARPMWVDIGCGGGGLLAAATARGFGAIGLETDADAVAQLQRQSLKVLHSRDLCADFLALDFAAAKTHVLSIQDLLPRCPDAAAVLAKAARVLDPGGVLLLGLDRAGMDDWTELLDEYGFNVAVSVPAPDDASTVQVHALRRADSAATATSAATPPDAETPPPAATAPAPAAAVTTSAAAGTQTYRVILVHPGGYVHAEALTELLETVYYGLKQTGVPVYYRETEQPANARLIIFGAHLLDADGILAVPSDAIIFNSEQIYGDSHWLKAPYLKLLKTRLVWDYSADNARKLRELGAPAVQHVPLGYVPEHTRIAPAAQDIDVLFYGSITPRRQRILEALTRSGLKVEALFGVYGEARDRHIARAKVVLNLHQYDDAQAKAFEIVRVSYLLSNSKAVVAECGADTAPEPDLNLAFRAVPYDKLVDACVELARDEAARARLAADGHRLFSQRQAGPILARTLQEEAAARTALVGVSSGSRVQAARLPANAVLPIIEVIAVAYKRIGELRVFVQSWLNQSSDRWRLRVLHDGHDDEFVAVMEEYRALAPDQISYECSRERYNDYGHSLRELGLRTATGDYVLITNADNYYIPKAIEYLVEAVVNNNKPHVVMFDMIHSHFRAGARAQPSYAFFQTSYARGSIDMGSAIVRTRLARKAGFRDKSHDGDATYFEDVLRARAPKELQVCKLPRVLLVHN